VECFDLFAQSLFGLFALNRQALYTGGAMIEDLDVSRRFLMCPLLPPTGWI